MFNYDKSNVLQFFMFAIYVSLLDAKVFHIMLLSVIPSVIINRLIEFEIKISLILFYRKALTDLN